MAQIVNTLGEPLWTCDVCGADYLSAVEAAGCAELDHAEDGDE